MKKMLAKQVMNLTGAIRCGLESALILLLASRRLKRLQSTRPPPLTTIQLVR